MKKIKVMGKTVKIKKVKHLLRDHETYGTFNPKKMLITIDKHLTENTYQITLAHEILHCILHLSGFNEFLSSKKEESLVRILEYNFFDIYKKIIKNE